MLNERRIESTMRAIAAKFQREDWTNWSEKAKKVLAYMYLRRNPFLPSSLQARAPALVVNQGIVP
jgi:hypothetical protein